jgi:hypothetical protein
MHRQLINLDFIEESVSDNNITVEIEDTRVLNSTFYTRLHENLDKINGKVEDIFNNGNNSKLQLQICMSNLRKMEQNKHMIIEDAEMQKNITKKIENIYNKINILDYNEHKFWLEKMLSNLYSSSIMILILNIIIVIIVSAIISLICVYF